MQIGEELLRTAIAYLVMLVLCRIMGKKQVSQMTFFNYVAGITFGAIAASLVIDTSKDLGLGILSLVEWSVLTILMGIVSLQSPRLRKVIDGQPTIMIRNGKILDTAMKESRLNMDDLTMLLRKKNVFSIMDVDYAILEPDGALSVLKKQHAQAATKKDVYAKPSPTHYLPTEIISDGRVVQRNLQELNLSRDWLEQQLRQLGVSDVKKVFYAEIQADGSLHVDEFQERVH
ncbi:DUF421 domain-containing protein [Tumebacillus sp. ITR2]|uniref:DUF421 domain-containing protein n=1 Tax=Tumebacillus amylolyticus TaxID=2801339 RepID=A0ABS1JBC3_9BACL|nr:DUF421 domain-containing protein [Tumebacillus amylolyticus]MBL0387571.1 DUF421 domain-containing protein [Tumebacillus amylolyticus]